MAALEFTEPEGGPDEVPCRTEGGQTYGTAKKCSGIDMCLLSSPLNADGIQIPAAPAQRGRVADGRVPVHFARPTGGLPPAHEGEGRPFDGQYTSDQAPVDSN